MLKFEIPQFLRNKKKREELARLLFCMVYRRPRIRQEILQYYNIIGQGDIVMKVGRKQYKIVNIGRVIWLLWLPGDDNC